MGLRLVLALVLVAWSVDRAAAADRVLALFPVYLDSGSLEPVRQDELERLSVIEQVVREEMTERGFQVIGTESQASRIEQYAKLHACNACEVTMARELGADVAAVAWVQKVSNLILHINMRLRDVATGETLKSGSVDIRGNTDDSWARGARYLIERRLYKEG